jgi:hypothetical protein
LYCFFVIEHERRRILHFNVTQQPTADWVMQQLRETFPEAAPYRYTILNNDSIFSGNAIDFLEASGLKAKRTGIHAPWQNGTAERWSGSLSVVKASFTTPNQQLRAPVVAMLRYLHSVSCNRV